MKKLKIAVIGVGNISECHILAYLANPNVELYAFCDIDPVRLSEKGKLYGVSRLYTSEEEMLRALPELDAVSVLEIDSFIAIVAAMIYAVLEQWKRKEKKNNEVG